MNLRYERDIAAARLAARLFYNHYRYLGDYWYPGLLNQDEARSDAWGAELRFTLKADDRHRIVFGGEFVDRFCQDQINYDAFPYWLYLDDQRSLRTWAFFSKTNPCSSSETGQEGRSDLEAQNGKEGFQQLGLVAATPGQNR